MRSGQTSSNVAYRGFDDTDDFEPVRPQMMEEGELEDSQSFSQQQMRTQGSYTKVGYDQVSGEKMFRLTTNQRNK